MAQTPPRDVGGFLPSSATRSRASPSAVPPHFAVDAINSHTHQHSQGPILSSTSPVVSRSRRSQPPSHGNTPAPHVHGAEIDVRASMATLAAAQPGRLSCVGGLNHDAPIVSEPPLDVDADPTAETEVVQPLPLRPAGRMLMLNCFTNWGDPHFIGLCGIEVFDARGAPIELRPDHVFSNAQPPTTANDPHCDAAWTDLSNLCTRPLNTTDANRMWMARYQPGEAHAIVFLLPETTHVGLLRIWNYNHGRVHTTRGVRLVEVTLDDQVIFRGEVQQASGVPANTCEEGLTNCETLIYTDDSAVLELVASRLDEAADRDRDLEQNGANPMRRSVSRFVTLAPPTHDAAAPVCESITIRFHSTWGNPCLVGLSALRLLDAEGNDVEELTANVEVPEDVAARFGSNICNELEALFDADPTTAWFAQLLPHLALRIDLPRPTAISALLVANAGVCDLDCGAHTVTLLKNRTEVLAEDFVFRKAPVGLTALLFQTVRFSDLLDCRTTGATVASSVTARAAVGLRRAGMLQTPWPADYADCAPAMTLLPVGYVASITVEFVPDEQTPIDNPTTVEILTVTLLRSTDTAATPLFTSACLREDATAEPTEVARGGTEGYTIHDVTDSTRLRFVFASETPICLEGLKMALTAPKYGAVVQVAIDDAPVFAGTWNARGQITVLPFTRSTQFLQAHKTQLYQTM